MSDSLDRPIAVTPDSRFIIAGAGNYRNHPGYIKFWDFKTKQLVRRDRWDMLVLANILALPDSRTIVVSGRADGYLNDRQRDIVWGDVFTPGYTSVLGKSQYTGSLELLLARDKKWVRFGGMAWDWRKKGLAVWHSGGLDLETWVKSMGKIEIASGNFLYPTSTELVVENIKTGQIICRFDPHHNQRLSLPLKVAPNSEFCLYPIKLPVPTSPSRFCLGMWNLKSGKLVHRFEKCSGTFQGIDITSDNRYAVISAFAPNDIIWVVDLATGDIQYEFDPTQ